MLNKTLCQVVDNLESELVDLRRHLHRYPELSGQEFETTRFLAEQLDGLGVPYRLGPEQRGLVVDFGPAQPRRRLALRADIDAIPVQDSKNVDYRSRVANVMHACGHDAHSTILLGALRALHQWFQQEQPNFGVRAIFQPEEETATGARRMIEWGVLDGVNAIFGLHVDPDRPLGTIGLKNGPVTAHCDEVLVEVRGKGGHAARPHETIDPIAAAVQLISASYVGIPRAVNSHESVVFSFGSIMGGEVSNVIPDRVSLMGTLRTLDAQARQAAIDVVRRGAEGVMVSTGTEIHLDFGTIVPSVVADRHLTDLIRQSSEELLGSRNVQEIPRASMGGEDFAFYCQTLPAAFIRLGCAGRQRGNLPLHNSGFDIDEGALAIGSKILALAAVHYFNSQND